MPRQEERTYALVHKFAEQVAAAAEELGVKNDDPAAFTTVLGLFGVEWPEGAEAKYAEESGRLRVRNTPENLTKLEAILAEFNTCETMVEVDTVFVEAGREALEAAGYFATNRVEGAVLKERLLARSDVEILDAPRLCMQSGEEAVVKHVKEYIFPTDFDVYVRYAESAATNAATGIFAVTEPQEFSMREVGVIVEATATLCYNGNLTVTFNAQYVGEPKWMDYGAKADWAGSATYDIVAECPFFPVTTVNTMLAARSGETFVFGGAAAPGSDDPGRFVLVFVTPRRMCGKNDNPSSHIDAERGKGEVRQTFDGEGMESRTYHYEPPSFCCALPALTGSDDEPESDAENAAETAEPFKAWLSERCGAEWPDGSALHILNSFGMMWIKTTPANFARIEKFLNGFESPFLDGRVELDVRYLEAGREALMAAGYFGAERVDAATLQERLMARNDVTLASAPRIMAQSGNETIVKGVVEYYYPCDFDVQGIWSSSDSAEMDWTKRVAAAAAVEPQSFTMREVGTLLVFTPWLNGDETIDVSLDTQFIGEPDWKDYGVKAKWDGAASYDLPMAAPFFPVASAEAKVSVKPGTTILFGGGANRRQGSEDKFMLIFVTPRFIAR